MRLPTEIGGAGIQSDQLVRPPTATYHPAPGAVAVALPERPDYWHSNLLVLEAPPRVADAERWRALWSREVAGRSGAGHPLVHFELPWRDRDAAISSPAPPDTAVEWDTVFRAPPVLTGRSPGRSPHLVQPLVSDLDWEALRTLLALDEIDDAAAADVVHWQTDFLRWRLAMYRHRAEGAQAAFFGVWHEATLVGAAGVLWDATLGLARYQGIVTHPAHRRQGICSDLLAAAQQHLADRGWGLIIVAEHGSLPERLYASLGFEPVGLRGSWHLAGTS